MTRQEYRAALRDAVYLVACALNEKKPSKKRVERMDIPRVLAAAKTHLLGAAVSMVLASVGIYSAEMTEELAKAKRKNALLDTDRAALFAQLSASGIWHMPLKGAVLAKLYPEYGMRQMSDNDILVDASRAADIRGIMEGLGFTTEAFGESNHDVYMKEPVSNFEIHTSLFTRGFDEKIFEYYEHVEERLLGDGFEKHFSPEDFYIYMIAHEYKHFSSGGTGLRSLADTYVYLKNFPLRYKDAAMANAASPEDTATAPDGISANAEPARTERFLDLGYIEAETEKLGFAAYERQNRSLAMHLFGRQTPTEGDKKMLAYMLESGTYGTIRHSIENRMEKNNFGKLGYMLYRFKVPVRVSDPLYNSFARFYPVFYRHKILLPALPFYRVFRSIAGGRFKNEAEAIRSITVR